ncbi:MAG: hypothetical protein II902_00955, partial [Selenomonadaceae bacterium]|nr:hypothetical protein [Selenomonadaceae bacterium]
DGVRRRTPRTGNPILRAVYDQRPREAPFSFASFLLGEQKKRRFQNAKEIFQPNESEDWFCESTLEKEGTPPA